MSLALGGGGAKGFAHVGVIEALAKHDIEITGIVGTSVGARRAAQDAHLRGARIG